MTRPGTWQSTRPRRDGGFAARSFAAARLLSAARVLPALVAAAVLVPGAAVAGDTSAALAGAAVTATARAPATMVIGRHPGGAEVVLDLDVTAFRPPRHGGVAAVVTLSQDGDGGRRAEAGSFAIFPARRFKARKPEEVRSFRLDAAPALTGLGLDTTTVRVTVRLDPATEGGSAAGARLTLGAARFVARDDGGGTADDRKAGDPSAPKDPKDPKADNPPADQRPDQPR